VTADFRRLGGARGLGPGVDASDSPFATWPEIVEELFTARGNPQLMKAFVNLKLGQTWQESAEEARS